MHFDSGEGCGFQGCEMEESEHYHCKDEGCETLFRSEDGVKEHGRNHFIQDQVSETFFQKIDPEEEEAKSPEDREDSECCGETCPHNKAGGAVVHYHCKWVSPNKMIAGDSFLMIKFLVEDSCNYQ